jgi:hypothetical protein
MALARLHHDYGAGAQRDRLTLYAELGFTLEHDVVLMIVVVVLGLRGRRRRQRPRDADLDRGAVQCPQMRWDAPCSTMRTEPIALVL